MHDFEWLLVLLAGAVTLTAVARRLKLPFPSLLALGGTALALFVAPVLLDAAYEPVMCLVVIAVGIATFARMHSCRATPGAGTPARDRGDR